MTEQICKLTSLGPGLCILASNRADDARWCLSRGDDYCFFFLMFLIIIVSYSSFLVPGFDYLGLCFLSFLFSSLGDLDFLSPRVFSLP